MRLFMIFALLFTIVQCVPKREEANTPPVRVNGVDPDFKVQFDNCIQIISLRQVDCKKVNCAADYWNAVYAFHCLHAITGIESNIIVNSEAPYFYPTTESKDFTEYFYEDLVRWNDWYEQNKLSMPLAKADSLLKVESAQAGYEVKWPQPYTLIFSSNPPTPPADPTGAATAGN